jgi:hypothetical protein
MIFNCICYKAANDRIVLSDDEFGNKVEASDSSLV